MAVRKDSVQSESCISGLSGELNSIFLEMQNIQRILLNFLGISRFFQETAIQCATAVATAAA